MPKPKKGEDKKDYIGRCMGNEEMGKKFDDTKQRAAVCYSFWDKSLEESMTFKRYLMIEMEVSDKDADYAYKMGQRHAKAGKEMDDMDKWFTPLYDHYQRGYKNSKNNVTESKDYLTN